ncbi:TPA: hypothetical protein ACIJR6_004852 [Klebsiella aerogenes]
MNNEIERIAQQNDMSIEFVRWFFNEKKAACGEQWFLALGAMWEGWKARGGEATALALTLQKSREASGCPAGVDLQDWVKQLAEENLTMKDAIECHKAGFTVCEACGEENGSWNDDVCKALDEIAATDRIVAGIKADGASEFISRLQQCVDEGDFEGDEVAVIVGAIDCGKEFCEQLREGDK